MIHRILILLLVLAPSLSAKIEFVGVFYLDGEGSFSLVQSDTGAKSGWIHQGQSFEGYRIESHDPEAQVLQLISPEGRLELRLRASVIKAKKITIQGTLRIGADREIDIKDAVIVLGEESRFPIDDKSWVRVRAVADDKTGAFRYEIRFEEKDKDGGVTLLSAPNVTAPPNTSFSVESGEYSFSYEP